jgi:hypothetical protein
LSARRRTRQQTTRQSHNWPSGSRHPSASNSRPPFDPAAAFKRLLRCLSLAGERHSWSEPSWLWFTLASELDAVIGPSEVGTEVTRSASIR